LISYSGRKRPRSSQVGAAVRVLEGDTLSLTVVDVPGLEPRSTPALAGWQADRYSKREWLDTELGATQKLQGTLADGRIETGSPNSVCAASKTVRFLTEKSDTFAKFKCLAEVKFDPLNEAPNTKVFKYEKNAMTEVAYNHGDLVPSCLTCQHQLLEPINSIPH